MVIRGREKWMERKRRKSYRCVCGFKELEFSNIFFLNVVILFFFLFKISNIYVFWGIVII